MKSKASSSSTTGKSKPRSGSSSAVLELAWPPPSSTVPAQNLYAATNSGCDREKGIFSRCTDHDDQTAFEQRQENLAWFYQGDGSHPKAGPSHLKTWLPLRFLVGVFTVNRCIKSPKGILSRSCDRRSNTGLSDPRRSIENHRGQTIGLDHATNDFAFSNQVLLTDDLIDRPWSHTVRDCRAFPSPF